VRSAPAVSAMQLWRDGARRHSVGRLDTPI